MIIDIILTVLDDKTSKYHPYLVSQCRGGGETETIKQTPVTFILAGRAQAKSPTPPTPQAALPLAVLWHSQNHSLLPIFLANFTGF